MQDATEVNGNTGSLGFTTGHPAAPRPQKLTDPKLQPVVCLLFSPRMWLESTDFMRAHVTGWDHFEANEVGFKELYQLFRLVTEQVGQEPIIIDADDLLKQPGVLFHL